MKHPLFAIAFSLLAVFCSMAAGSVAFGAFDLTKPDAYFNFAKAGETDSTFRLPGIAQTDPRSIAANIISSAAGFLGIIAVVIILISGVEWMTAGGNEDTVKKAQTRLLYGVIGLVIVLAAWSIGYYGVMILSDNIYKTHQE